MTWNGESAMEVAERLRKDNMLDEAAEAMYRESAVRIVNDWEGLEELDDFSQWTVSCYSDVARMFRNFEAAIVELSRLPAEQTRALTGIVQAVLNLRERCLDDARKMLDDDPTPWCHGCGAKTKAQCGCGERDPMD